MSNSAKHKLARLVSELTSYTACLHEDETIMSADESIGKFHDSQSREGGADESIGKFHDSQSREGGADSPASKGKNGTAPRLRSGLGEVPSGTAPRLRSGLPQGSARASERCPSGPPSGTAPRSGAGAPASLPSRDISPELKKLEKEVSSCKKCSLSRSRIKTVFGVGNPNAEVIFIGEGPGYDEDRIGEPFVGRAGKLLDKILNSIELSREKVYIANIVKCHPMADPSAPDSRGNDRPPTPEEISACRSYLDRQIALVSPRCVVALGSVAAKVLLNVSSTIGSLRGKWHEYSFDASGGPAKTVKLLAVYHPSALLRNPSLKQAAWHDFKMLRSFLQAGAEK